MLSKVSLGVFLFVLRLSQVCSKNSCESVSPGGTLEDKEADYVAG